MSRTLRTALALVLAAALVLGPFAAPARAVAAAPGSPAWWSPGFLARLLSFLQGPRGERGWDLRVRQPGQAEGGGMVDPNGGRSAPGQAEGGGAMEPDG